MKTQNGDVDALEEVAMPLEDTHVSARGKTVRDGLCNQVCLQLEPRLYIE